jgi:uncharacterized membrane protein YphA (DoxX/SURF4 family)
MLSIFPDLLTYSLLGITIIRVALGFLGVYLGLIILSKKNQVADFVTSLKIPLALFAPWILAVLFIISGGLLIIGLYTQVVCIVLACLLLELMITDIWSRGIFGNSIVFYLGFILISLSLLFLGPGAFAFDLPF